MKTRRFISTIITSCGFLLAALTLLITLFAVHATPAMLKTPDAAQIRVQGMMDAICSGSYAQASSFLYGKPNLGKIPDDSSKAVELIWDAYRTSLSYSLAGSCKASESGASIDVTVKSLDLPRIMEGLDSRVQRQLDKKLNSTKNSSDLFDAGNQLKQEAAEQILTDAVILALDDKTYRDQTITLELTYEGGNWWVIPNDALLNVLSGSFAG